MPPKPIITDIDALEQEAQVAPEPGEEIIILPLPTLVYRALSDAAARKGQSVAQLLARALQIAIEED